MTENDRVRWWKFECNGWSHCGATVVSSKSLDGKLSTRPPEKS